MLISSLDHRIELQGIVMKNMNVLLIDNLIRI